MLSDDECKSAIQEVISAFKKFLTQTKPGYVDMWEMSDEDKKWSLDWRPINFNYGEFIVGIEKRWLANGLSKGALKLLNSPTLIFEGMADEFRSRRMNQEDAIHLLNLCARRQIPLYKDSIRHLLLRVGCREYAFYSLSLFPLLVEEFLRSYAVIEIDPKKTNIFETREGLFRKKYAFVWILLRDYLYAIAEKTTPMPIIPLGAGLRWWNDAQEAWHAEINQIPLQDRLNLAPMVNWEVPFTLFQHGEYEAVAMTSSRDLIEEGFHMQHCSARYRELCRSGNSTIYSIRHAEVRVGTLEFDSKGRAKQLLGVLNKPIRRLDIIFFAMSLIAKAHVIEQERQELLDRQLVNSLTVSLSNMLASGALAKVFPDDPTEMVKNKHPITLYQMRLFVDQIQLTQQLPLREAMRSALTCLEQSTHKAWQ